MNKEWCVNFPHLCFVLGYYIYFCAMKYSIYILLSVFAFLSCETKAQQNSSSTSVAYRVPADAYKGELIPSITLKTIYVYPKMVFKSKKQERYYNRLVRDVKKTLPLAHEVRNAVIETYEYLQTLPDEKSRAKHIKYMEKALKKQYMPQMKKLTFSQGKLLIKLIDRECNQSSYQLVKAFMGPLKAGFYQTFAALFGASLKKEYRPEEDDRMIERVVILVESGVI